MYDPSDSDRRHRDEVMSSSQKVYIHEVIDVVGQNRARYMHHMTANWCPTARAERNQLCYGVWGTVGSTGAWPEVVNMWELDGWDGLEANFSHELRTLTMQDPTLAAWWAAAAELRRGGFDRILLPEPWSLPIDELVAGGAGGAVYAHELFTVPPGGAPDLLVRLAEDAGPAAAALGVRLIGGFKVAMGDDSECLALWSFPDWPTWSAYEVAWEGGGLEKWRRTLLDQRARFRRTLLVDAPLAPLRTGRQPQESDRRPLDAI